MGKYEPLLYPSPLPGFHTSLSISHLFLPHSHSLSLSRCNCLTLPPSLSCFLSLCFSRPPCRSPPPPCRFPPLSVPSLSPSLSVKLLARLQGRLSQALHIAHKKKQMFCVRLHQYLWAGQTTGAERVARVRRSVVTRVALRLCAQQMDSAHSILLLINGIIWPTWLMSMTQV